MRLRQQSKLSRCESLAIAKITVLIENRGVEMMDRTTVDMGRIQMGGDDWIHGDDAMKRIKASMPDDQKLRWFKVAKKIVWVDYILADCPEDAEERFTEGSDTVLVWQSATKATPSTRIKASEHFFDEVN